MTHKGSIVNNLPNSPSQIIFLLSFFLWKVAFIHPFHPLKFTTEADPPGPSNGGYLCHHLVRFFPGAHRLQVTRRGFQLRRLHLWIALKRGRLGWLKPGIFTLQVPIGGNLGFPIWNHVSKRVHGFVFWKKCFEVRKAMGKIPNIEAQYAHICVYLYITYFKNEKHSRDMNHSNVVKQLLQNLPARAMFYYNP